MTDYSSAYATHRWKAIRQRTDYGTGFEYLCVCDECGCEDRGHPAEFPELFYPVCDVDDLEVVAGVGIGRHK